MKHALPLHAQSRCIQTPRGRLDAPALSVPRGEDVVTCKGQARDTGVWIMKDTTKMGCMHCIINYQRYKNDMFASAVLHLVNFQIKYDFCPNKV